MRSMLLAAAVVVLAAPAARALAQDAAAGGAVFKQRCSACHTPPQGQAHGVGPNLVGVVGRKAGSTAYDYSAALKGSGLTWSRGNLDQFLSGPMKMVPGTRMLVSVPDAKQRADLVTYLASLKP